MSQALAFAAERKRRRSASCARWRASPRPAGAVQPGEGWTTLVVTPDHGVHAVDSVVTGWHEPAASHLPALTAILDEDNIERSYAAAVEHGYLWHEFGDSLLILP